MSTRCAMIVADSGIMIYKHSDGSPTILLHDLLPILKEVSQYRYFDPSYYSAQIVGRLMRLDHEWLEQQIKMCGEPEYGTPGMDLTHFQAGKVLGYGVEPFTGRFPVDLDYIYIVTPKYVEVRVPVFGKSPNRPFGFCDKPVLQATRRETCIRFDGTKTRADRQWAPNKISRAFKTRLTWPLSACRQPHVN